MKYATPNNENIEPRDAVSGPLRAALALCLSLGLTVSAMAQASQPVRLAETDRAVDLFAERFVEPDASAIYLIQPYDRLFIFVYGEEELSGPVLVRPDGRISVRLVQDVQAGGLTLGQLKQKLEERLTVYFDEPNVTVLIEEIDNSYQVYVTGEVRLPGVITSRTPITVLQAIAQAGSFEEWAKKNDIVIIRGSGADAVTFEFSYDRVIRGERLDQNIELMSGDVVAVPR